MSIAVDPNAAGRGIGKLLIDAFLEEMKRRGVLSVSLTTDRDDNEPVNTFYRNRGFWLTRQFVTPEGRWMNEYLITTKEA